MSAKKSARINVRVQPNAKRNEVIRFEDGVLYLRIAAPPVKGKANKASLDFLSDILGVSRARLSIEKGATSRKKVITVEGMSQAEAREKVKGFQT